MFTVGPTGAVNCLMVTGYCPCSGKRIWACCNVCIVVEIPEELCEVGVGEPGVKGELVGMGCVCTGEKELVGLGCVCTGEPLWVGLLVNPGGGGLEPFAEHEADRKPGYCRLYISSKSVSSTSRSSLPSIIGSS